MYVGFIFVLKGIRNLGSTYYALRVHGTQNVPRYAAQVHTYTTCDYKIISYVYFTISQSVVLAHVTFGLLLI